MNLLGRKVLHPLETLNIGSIHAAITPQLQIRVRSAESGTLVIKKDDDDEEEEYISFSPNKHGLLSLRDLFINSRPPVRPKTPAFNQTANNTLLSPNTLSSSPKLRGRSRGRGRRGASSRGQPFNWNRKAAYLEISI